MKGIKKIAIQNYLKSTVQRLIEHKATLATQLAYDYAIHRGGSYDVQQHVISKKYQKC